MEPLSVVEIVVVEVLVGELVKCLVVVVEVVIKNFVIKVFIDIVNPEVIVEIIVVELIAEKIDDVILDIIDIIAVITEAELSIVVVIAYEIGSQHGLVPAVIIRNRHRQHLRRVRASAFSPFPNGAIEKPLPDR